MEAEDGRAGARLVTPVEGEAAATDLPDSAGRGLLLDVVGLAAGRCCLTSRGCNSVRAGPGNLMGMVAGAGAGSWWPASQSGGTGGIGEGKDMGQEGEGGGHPTGGGTR